MITLINPSLFLVAVRYKVETVTKIWIVKSAFSEYTQLNFSQNSCPSLNANRTEDIEKSEYISDSILDISPLKGNFYKCANSTMIYHTFTIL